MRILIIAALGIMILPVLLIGCTSGSKQGGAQNMGQVQNTSQSYQNIEGGELKKLLSGNEQVVVVDVRQPEEYATGHISNAVLIPLGELVNRLGEIDKSKTVVVVCASGARSAQAADYMVGQGFYKVKNLVGGMQNWQGEVEKGGAK